MPCSGICGSKWCDENCYNDNKKPLSETNKYLKDSKLRKLMTKKHVISSSAIEDIVIKDEDL